MIYSLPMVLVDIGGMGMPSTHPSRTVRVVRDRDPSRIQRSLCMHAARAVGQAGNRSRLAVAT
jgi:hypothetical protein